MPEAPLANAPEARTATGEIVNQATIPPTTEVKPEAAAPVTEPPQSTSTPPSTEPKAEAKPEDKSLLNKEEKGAVPDKYEFKVPEGFVLDEAVNKEASELFKSLSLDQAGAQKLIDMYVAKTTEAAEAPFKAYTKMREDWQAAVKADTEIGSKLPQVKETVSRALDSLGDPALSAQFREAMDHTGAGDNPAFIKAFYRLAQRVTEGRPVAAGGVAPVAAPGSKPTSAAKALYPNLA